jgi:transglutaminase-like putative cysteine protease
MALLRGAGIPCRFHGATIHKELQKGVVEGLSYRIAPESIIHSWAEIRFDGRWVGLEGVILDAAYLDGLRETVAKDGGAFLGYGAGTEDIDDPPVAWCGTDTAIQTTGVNRDYGIFDDPDAFYEKHGANLSGLKAVLFKAVIRHQMNRKVASIRNCALPAPRIDATTKSPVGQGVVI